MGEFQLLSMYDLADTLRVPRHKLQYIVRSRRIEPYVRHGGVRWYGPKQIRKIYQGLNDIDRRKLSYPRYPGPSEQTTDA